MTTKIGYILLILLASWMPIACGQKSGSVSVDEFEQKLAQNPDAQLIDVRTPEEYQKGHLKNAVNWNIQDGQFEQHITELDKNKPVFVYCLSGGRSTQASNRLKEAGFKEVYNLNGGYLKWTKADKEVVQNSTTASSASPLPTNDFETTVKNSPLVLVDFSAVWCGPCKQLKPIVEKLEKEYATKLKVLTVDVDENPDIAKDKNIEALPTLLLYKNGQIVWQQIGLTDEATLRSQIDQYALK